MEPPRSLLPQLPEQKSTCSLLPQLPAQKSTCSMLPQQNSASCPGRPTSETPPSRDVCFSLNFAPGRTVHGLRFGSSVSTAADLREHVAELTGLPARAVKVSVAGKRLDDDEHICGKHPRAKVRGCGVSDFPLALAHSPGTRVGETGLCVSWRAGEAMAAEEKVNLATKVSDL